MNAARRSGLSPIVLSLGLGAALVWAVPGQAMADDVFPPDLPSECTLDNVAGAFGFNEDTRTGVRFSTGDSGGPTATIGILDLRPNGDAAVQFKIVVDRGADPITSEIIEGEWSVEPNCFGFINFPEYTSPRPGGRKLEIDFAFVAVENGTELLLIRDNPLETADAKLLFSR